MPFDPDDPRDYEREFEDLDEKLMDRYGMSEEMDTVMTLLNAMIVDINWDGGEAGFRDGTETEIYKRVYKALNALEG